MEFGYDEDRFEGDIDEDWICSVCMCVQKDP